MSLADTSLLPAVGLSPPQTTLHANVAVTESKGLWAEKGLNMNGFDSDR